LENVFDRASPAPVIVVSLGSLAVTSCARDKGRPNISNMMQAGSTEQEVLQEMISQSYDKFSLSLKDVQAYFVMIKIKYLAEYAVIS